MPFGLLYCEPGVEIFKWLPGVLMCWKDAGNMLEVPGQGGKIQHPEVMLFFRSLTLQPKTFPWALVPSSGSDDEWREAL